MKFHRILLGLILGFTIYALLNLFIEVPFSVIISSLAIIGGAISIIALFADSYKIKTTIISSQITVLIMYWIISFISITAGFSSIYLEMIRQDPHHFVGIIDGMSATYFSVVTFATVGYGDIYPESTAAKFVVMSEIWVAIILLPITIGTSIARVINHKLKQQDEEFQQTFNKNEHNQLFRIK